MKSNFTAKFALVFIFQMAFSALIAQHPSAIAEYESTEQGVLIPRMTAAERMAIDSPALGLMVFQSNNDIGIYINTGNSASPNWVLVGAEAGTISDSDGDTKIQTEESPDEDVIRVDIGGAEHFIFVQNDSSIARLEVVNNEQNTLMGNQSGQQLDPSGTNTGFANTFYGYNTGILATEASYNTLIGRTAGLNLLDGDENVAIGDESGSQLGSGRGNSLLGANSGQNTSSDYNTFLGYFAGQGNTTGERNVYVGNSSGRFSDFGHDNTGVGDNSLSQNNAGQKNTALGFQSMTFNENGSNNTATGYKALNENVTGNNHTATGMHSLWMNRGGVGSVAIGFNSGAYDTLSVRNVYIGAFAGRGGTISAFGQHSKQDNVMIGYEAGFNNKGNGNVMLGYQAGKDDTTSNDKLIIENSDASVPLIWGDFVFDRVGIARVATTNTLEVNGTASKASPGDWLGNSDERLKKNISQLNGAQILDRLLSLRGVSYEWNDRSTDTPRPEGVQYGLIAQDIRQAFPTLVSEDAQGYLQTPYGTYDAMFIEVIRHLSERIEELESEKAGMQAQMDLWEERLSRLEEAVGSPSPGEAVGS